MNTADGSGVLGRLAYAINNGLTVGTNLSYDDSFKSRFSADIKWRFNTNGGPGKETPKTNAAISALTSTPSNRDVRVHDADGCGFLIYKVTFTNPRTGVTTTECLPL